MDLAIHAAMTREALAARMSPRALEIVVAANLRQDSLRGLLFHDEYHFDNGKFDASYQYIREQRGLVLAVLLSPGILGAWVAFGRLIHTAQDFYAHTNYVALWLDSKNGSSPTPLEIEPVRKNLIDSPKLISARVNVPLETLYYLPPLRPLVLALSSPQSHARMNLDSPTQGPLFAFARAAAVKRTTYEFEILEKLLTPEMFLRFTDV